MRFLSTDNLKVLFARNGVIFAMIALVIAFTIVNPRFFSLINAETVLGQIAELGLIALPVAFVTMQGTADLSVGSVASVSAVLSAQVMVHSHNAVLGIVVGLAFGAVAGLLNGILISYLNLNTLVVTLGFLSVWGGLALLLTSGSTVSSLPHAFVRFGSFSMLGVPVDVVMLIIAVVGAWYVLNHTSRGIQILAIGGNQRAAYLMGIKVRSVKLQTFVASGIMAALAGIMLSAKLTAAPPTVGTGLELNALTVVLLGGVAFEGGSGRISGVIAGLLFVGVLDDGLIMLNVSAYLQTILVGAVLVVAVALDRSLQRLIKGVWQSRGKRAVAKQGPGADDDGAGTSAAAAAAPAT